MLPESLCLGVVVHAEFDVLLVIKNRVLSCHFPLNGQIELLGDLDNPTGGSDDWTESPRSVAGALCRKGW